MVARLRWAGAHNERSPTVTRRDGRTSSWLDDDETAGQQRGKEGQTGIEVQCRAELGIQGPPVWNWCAQEHKASENWQECQWRNLSNVDWRSTVLQCWEPTGGDSDFSRLVGKPDNVALPKSSFVSTRLTIRVRKTDDGTVRRTLRSWRKTAKQPATVPLNARPHAEVGVNENTKVTHRLGWNDVMQPNPECRSWQLVYKCIWIRPTVYSYFSF